MLNISALYKYEAPYKCLFVITQCGNNRKVVLQCGWIKFRYNIRRIKPYTPDTKVEDITPKNMCDYGKVLSPVIYLCIIYQIFDISYIIGCSRIP